MPDGNEAQTRLIADTVAEATIMKFVSQHPELNEVKIPAPLKWAGAIIAGLFTDGTQTVAIPWCA